MAFPFLDPQRSARPTEPVALPEPDRSAQNDPASYLMEPRLADAANVALLLGQPLLLTGEPGTGKTQLAHHLAWALGLGAPLQFHTQSHSVARDLFYSYDAMARFHAAQTREGSQANVDYLHYHALGLAILRSHPRAAVADVLPAAAEHQGPQRSVVLVDEVDKAPRDFPNDLLHEVEAMSFRVAELGQRELVAAPGLRPVLVLTSNSERNLPDAFLRRCVFHHIPFPDSARLAAIVRARLPALPEGALLRDALVLLERLRGANLRKPPATAELINWLQALAALGADAQRPLKASPEALRRSLSTLGKIPEDVAEIEAQVARHLQG